MQDIIIKEKKISNICLIIFLSIICIASFVGYFSSETEKDIAVLICGILFGSIDILLILYVLFKYPYLKITSNGLYIRGTYGNNLYGSEIHIPWTEVKSICSNRHSLTQKVTEMQKNELDELELCTNEDEEFDGIYIIAKKNKKENFKVYDISMFFNEKECDKTIKIINDMWNYYTSSI